MRTHTVQGIILKRKNVGEADRILTVFTREKGKIQIKAKGVRKIASKRASHIEPLNKASLSIYKGSGMPVLTEAAAIEYFTILKEDLTKLGFAYHICELVDGLCPEEQENSRVFDMLEEILHQLSLSEKNVELIHAFEVELLTVLGYWSGNTNAENLNTAFYIENILERKLKTRQILPRLTS